MTFNIRTASITQYIDELAYGDDYNDHYRYYEYLIHAAIRRPLTRELSNQERPDNLRKIQKYNPNIHADWIGNAIARGEAVYDFHPNEQLKDKINHICNWLYAAWQNDEPWLHDTDKSDRPIKLAKLGSIQQAVNEADKAMLRASNRKVDALNPEDLHIEKTFPDGARIVRLLTEHALDAESAAMKHCVGLGAYDHKLRSNTHTYYSLRSASGKSRATLEVQNTDNKIIQCKGKQNQPPIDKYMHYIQEFIQDRQFHQEIVTPSSTFTDRIIQAARGRTTSPHMTGQTNQPDTDRDRD